MSANFWLGAEMMAKGAIGALRTGAGAVWKSHLGKGAVVGAGLGGLYGGFSDNGSVVGGVLGGALGGVAAAGLGRGGYRSFRTGIGVYRNTVGTTMERLGAAGHAGWLSALHRGRGSVEYMGNTTRKAYNGFRAMW